MLSVLSVCLNLQGLRDICTAEGALLCFDEVMTGFRIARGCAQVR
jgi:glutamate-1-semialdehyde 2,1-aminomutase